MIEEHIYLKAQVESQGVIITCLLSLLEQEHPEIQKIKSDYPTLVRKIYEGLVENHYLLTGTWKKYLQDNLLDGTGVLLPDK